MFKIFKKQKEVVVRQKRVENYENPQALLSYFKEETGIDFSKKEKIVTLKLSNFCRDRGFFDFESFLENVKADNTLKQALFDYLTVNETYFYREFHQIEQLVQCVKKSDTKLRILCIPSSTGEEPYTIAIALLEAGIPKERFEIVGIDINAEVIAAAKRAVYNSRNLYKVPSPIKEKYFTLQDNQYQLSKIIAQLVTFKVVNLFDEAFLSLGRFDYIFCRNMMIYFDQETKQKAKQRIQKLLIEPKNKIFWGHADMV